MVSFTKGNGDRSPSFPSTWLITLLFLFVSNINTTTSAFMSPITTRTDMILVPGQVSVSSKTRQQQHRGKNERTAQKSSDSPLIRELAATLADVGKTTEKKNNKDPQSSHKNGNQKNGRRRRPHANTGAPGSSNGRNRKPRHSRFGNLPDIEW